MCSEILNEQNNSCFDKDATLVIKQEAIINNVKYIKDKTGAKIIAVVKENGYGLGVANLYHILQDQDIFMYAVTAPCEAIALRKEGCTEDILMLTPISDFSELVTMVSLGVVIALGSEDQIPELLPDVLEFIDAGIVDIVRVKDLVDQLRLLFNLRDVGNAGHGGDPGRKHTQL